MALNINQFQQSVAKGMLDLKHGSTNVLACQINSGSAGGLVAGQAMKIVNVVGGIPDIIECTAATDDVFGVIAYDIKDTTFNAGDKVEVAFDTGTIIYMQASAAIAANAKLMYVVSGQQVATATTGNTLIGRALDEATAAGQLIRVRMMLSFGAVA
jgi:hypothetical protein